jgi:RHS repeat-associated protein
VTTRSYGYGDSANAAGWLSSVTVSGSAAASRTYEYDDNAPGGNGNRTLERDGTGAALAGASYDDQDRLLTYGAYTYSHTAAGEQSLRVSPGDTLMTTYDALGNLVRAKLAPATYSAQPDTPLVGTVITYRIDGENRRVQKLVNGTPVQGWLYRDGLAPVAELDGTGAVVNRYVYGTQSYTPDLILRADGAYRVVTDQLGSIRAVVNVATGAVAQRIEYDAWGVQTLNTATEFQGLGYAGGLTDQDTKLVRFGARDYDPSVGLWTAKDPLDMEGHSTNLYRYSWNQPTALIDPAGLGRFEERPIWHLPFKITNHGGVLDKCDCEVAHEEYFYNNGKHTGGEPGMSEPTPDRDYPKNKKQYSPEPEQYDDDLMAEVINTTQNGRWSALGNQCQNRATRCIREFP